MRQDGRSGCPINRAVEALGDSWTLLVLRDIVFGGRRHFRELLSGSEEGIASNILADRLHRLVATGCSPGTIRVAGVAPPTASPSPPSPWCRSSRPWAPGGRRYRDTTEELAVRAELLDEGGPAMWEDLMAELRVTHLGAPAPAHPRAPVVERLRAAREGRPGGPTRARTASADLEEPVVLRRRADGDPQLARDADVADEHAGVEIGLPGGVRVAYRAGSRRTARSCASLGTTSAPSPASAAMTGRARRRAASRPSAACRRRARSAARAAAWVSADRWYGRRTSMQRVDHRRARRRGSPAGRRRTRTPCTSCG